MIGLIPRSTEAFLRTLYTAVLCLAMSAGVAHADTYQYSFLDTADSLSFTATSGNLITAGEVLSTSTCSAGVNSCFSAEISPGANGFVELFADSTGIVGLGTFHVTGDPAFFTVGDHGFGGATLDITHLGAVPEPSSCLLMATGLLGLSGMLRRKLHRLS